MRAIVGSTPTSRAKPAGVVGCEIWMKLSASKIPPSKVRETKSGLGGPPPTDLSECHFLATDSRTPYTANGVYPDAVGNGSEANQTAHFIGRWMSTRNEPGPVPAPPNGVRETKSGSETVSATVPG